jgi:EAL domain-containing protein (putative c-di-GMP-specific phosphodiesterase class I)
MAESRRLGLEVIAEGVENEEIMSRLRALGCDCAQGYYISRPLKGPELTEKSPGLKPTQPVFRS